MPRKLGFLLMPIGLVSFMASAFVWLFSHPPLPLWWDVTMAGGLLCVGWGAVLVLPKMVAKWVAIYVMAMSFVVPLITISLSR
jgi:hypothetical protein